MKKKTDTAKTKARTLKKKDPSQKERAPIAPLLQDEIEREIAALEESDLRRPSMSLNQFLQEYSSILHQAHRDKAAIVGAGYDWKKMALYEALFEELVLSLGESATADFRSPEKIRFERLVAEAQRDRVILKEVGTYVISKVKDRRITNYFNRVTSAKGLSYCLVSTLDLVALIRQYPDYASQIRPRGITVDDGFLKDASRRALDLLQSKGEIAIETSPIHAARLRQKRLMTLCIKARMDIKKFARAAFVKNFEYYNANYSSSARRAQYSRYKSSKQELEETAEISLV